MWYFNDTLNVSFLINSYNIPFYTYESIKLTYLFDLCYIDSIDGP